MCLGGSRVSTDSFLRVRRVLGTAIVVQRVTRPLLLAFALLLPETGRERGEWAVDLSSTHGF